MNRKHERDQKLEARTREVFSDSVRGLDGQTRSRLAQARAAAVAAASPRSSRWRAPAGFLPLGGVAAAALAVVLVWQGRQVPLEPIEDEVLSDLDILLDGDELELLEELEFYAWLLEQPEFFEISEDDGNG